MLVIGLCFIFRFSTYKIEQSSYRQFQSLTPDRVNFHASIHHSVMSGLCTPFQMKCFHGYKSSCMWAGFLQIEVN